MAADFTGLVQSFKLRRINPNVLFSLKYYMYICRCKCSVLTDSGLKIIEYVKKEKPSKIS
jgi:hypothetical protein